jgi:hypothetical protein
MMTCRSARGADNRGAQWRAVSGRSGPNWIAGRGQSAAQGNNHGSLCPFASCLWLFFHMKIRLRLAFLTVNGHNSVCIAKSYFGWFETAQGTSRLKWNDTIERTF